MFSSQVDIPVRHQLLDRIWDARRRSDALFSLVRPQFLYERPIPERHRIIFYVGHLEAFDWNLLKDRFFGLKASQPTFDRLFAFGIDPVGGGLPSDQPMDWPSFAAIHDYVAGIRAALDEKLSSGILEENTHSREGHSLDTLLNVAIEHRLMHVETLAYMLHQLPHNQKIPQSDRPVLSAPHVPPRMIRIPAGMATLGLIRGEKFGWDNEYESHTANVPAFEIEEHKVTNRQYLEFMAAGGYDTRAYWSNEDWNWRDASSIVHPVFWRKTSAGWSYRTMFEDIPLPLDWPVYVSHAEAAAYSRWAGKSLPTEAEWHRAACGTTEETQRPYPWGNDAPDPTRGNFDLERWNPVPVQAFPRGQSALGVHEMLGNGWEWTSTIFAPFPGFKAFSFYPGYSADFFDGKHFVMKGASARTAACMLRPTFRNWFQPHYQYVYAGFRCVCR